MNSHWQLYPRKYEAAWKSFEIEYERRVAVAEGHNTGTPGAHIYTTTDGKNFTQKFFVPGVHASLMGARMISETEGWAAGGKDSASASPRGCSSTLAASPGLFIKVWGQSLSLIVSFVGSFQESPGALEVFLW